MLLHLVDRSMLAVQESLYCDHHLQHVDLGSSAGNGGHDVSFTGLLA